MPVDSIYFLLEGEVAVSVDEGDKMIPLGNLGPGQWLGEISVLSGEMLASSSVTTVTPVKLLRLKHQAFEDLLSSSDVVARAVLDEMVKMLTERLKTSLNAGSVPITAAEIDKPQKRVGLLWSLFGGSGG
jgi:CRP-like cAMP-binding protein